LNNRADHHPSVLRCCDCVFFAFRFALDVLGELCLRNKIKHRWEYKAKRIDGNSSNKFKDLVHVWDQDGACHDYGEVDDGGYVVVNITHILVSELVVINTNTACWVNLGLLTERLRLTDNRDRSCETCVLVDCLS